MSNATLPLLPTDEEIAIRESVRQICESFGERYTRACFEAGKPPEELWMALGQAGFVGINISPEWGGGGLGMHGLQAVGEEMAAAGNGSLMLVVSSAIAGTLLDLHGSDEQKECWLRSIAAGTQRMAFAITEPDAGTNSHNLRTELRKNPVAGGYVLNGQKTFISGVEDAHAVLVVARFRSDTGQLGKPTICIVEVDAPGFTRSKIPMPYLGAELQWTLYFDDVAITSDNLVGEEGAGLAVVFDGLNPERIAVAALCNGYARRALDKAATYARERKVWKTPIGAHQGVAHPLATAKIELELARLMTQKAAALIDERASASVTGEACNMAKYAAARAATDAVDAAIQTHGGNGITIEYGLSDMWWPVRTMRIAPVSEQMILNHIAQHSLGLPKSY